MVTSSFAALAGDPSVKGTVFRANLESYPNWDGENMVNLDWKSATKQKALLSPLSKR